MESGTTDILRRAAAWRAEGRRVALATVVKTWGSAPRPPGGHMVVCGTGEFLGSVSGGCVEPAVMEEAKVVMESATPRLVEYGVTHEDAWAVGLACGGQVRIHIEPIGPGGLPDGMLDELIRARESGHAVVMATTLPGGPHALLRSGDAGAPASGGPSDTPAPDAARAVLPTPLSALPPDAVRVALRSDLAQVLEMPAGNVFLRPHNPPVRVVIIGAVHLAQALIPLATAVGFETIVVDPREAFAADDRFPGVRIVHAWPGPALRELAPDHRTAVVILTHDAKLDDPAATEALASDAFYVGALGSRRTHTARLDRLRESGVVEEALERIHAPIGLDIGARTPGEVALAIMAEIVATLRQEGAA